MGEVPTIRSSDTDTVLPIVALKMCTYNARRSAGNKLSRLHYTLDKVNTSPGKISLQGPIRDGEQT